MLVVEDFHLNREVIIDEVEPEGVILVGMGATPEGVRDILLNVLHVEKYTYIDGVYDPVLVLPPRTAVKLNDEFYLLRSEDIALLDHFIPDPSYKEISLAEFLKLLNEKGKYDFSVNLENTLFVDIREGKKKLKKLFGLMAVFVFVLLLGFGLNSLVFRHYQKLSMEIQKEVEALQTKKLNMKDRYYVFLKGIDLEKTNSFLRRVSQLPLLPDGRLEIKEGSYRYTASFYVEALPYIISACEKEKFVCDYRIKNARGGVEVYEVDILWK